MKVCCRCGLVKDKFYKDRRAADGLYSHCAECDRKQALARAEVDRPAKLAAYRKNKAAWGVVNRAWAVAHPERMRVFRAAWRRSNASKCTALSAKSRARKLSATPSWLTPLQLREIDAVYRAAKDLSTLTGEPMEVDHIIPLQGENVCGLHVPWNLQILTRVENRKKGNKKAA